MKPENLRKIDIKLLLAFHTLMEEKNVTKAADKLCSSQPAMSRNLRLLREIFGDNLFTRQSHGLSPSAKAEKLHAQVVTILDDITRLVSPTEINLQTLKRTFSIGMMDPISQAFVSELMLQLQQSAPNVTLRIQNLEPYSLDSLVAGHLDFIINFGNEAPANIHSRILRHIQPTCMMGKSHPLASRPFISKAEYDQQQHVDFIVPGFNKHHLPEWLFDNRKIFLQTNNMMTALRALTVNHMIMLGGDLIAHTAPLAEHIALVPFERGEELPKVTARIMWHNRFHQDTEHKWLRGVICDLFDQKIQTAPVYANKN